MGDEKADTSAPAGAEAAPAEATKPKRGNWFRTQLDRVKTKWVGTIGTVLFLIVTAAFGGLGTVKDPGPPTVPAGDPVTTETLVMTVQRAYLADRVEDGVSIDSESDQRVLAVQLRITSLTGTPRVVRSLDEGLGKTTIEDGPSETPDVSRPGESTGGGPVTLQPGLEDTVILSWAVDPGSFAEGDEVRIVFPDPQEYRGQFLDDDLHWVSDGTSATVTASLEDDGEGDPW